jgi:hypothetical protein
MFHESLLAPFRQTNRFRSPDVARLPFVGGSMHTVMTPWCTPARGVTVLLADAIDAAATQAINTATARSKFRCEFN